MYDETRGHRFSDFNILRLNFSHPRLDFFSMFFDRTVSQFLGCFDTSRIPTNMITGEIREDLPVAEDLITLAQPRSKYRASE